MRARPAEQLTRRAYVRYEVVEPMARSSTAWTTVAPTVKLVVSTALLICSPCSDFFLKPHECLPPAGVGDSRLS